MNPPSPRISVVVISRDEGTWLRRTVENLRDTLPGDHEILVVDDGSTDGSAAFLGRKRKGPKLMRARGLGVARARNHGARQATGDIIVFSDAHMVYPRGWWQPLVEVLRLPHAGAAAPAVASTARPANFGHGFTIPTPDLEPAWIVSRKQEPVQTPILPGCCLAVPRLVFQRTGGFDEELRARGGVDAETGVRFWLSGFENWLVAESRVRHYFRNAPPYPVSRADILHNRLRLALVHLSHPRISAVLSALNETEPDLPEALLLTGGAAAALRRQYLFLRRKRDDDWFFERFGLTW